MPQTNPGARETGKATASAAPELSRTTVIIVTASATMASFMQALDGTIANVALPYMQGTMAASQEEINWVLTSYIVSAAIMTAPTGFFAARFGRTRVYVTSILGFTVTSVLCGASQSLDQIVFFRILQGMFGAALTPLSQAIMFDTYPLEKRATAMSIWTMGVMMGPIMGPILGGYITEYYSWRWVFYVNVPFGIVTAVAVLICLRESARSKFIRLDWVGFAALSLAIGAFQTMLDRGQTLDWFNSPEIIIEACVAGLALYIFLVQFSLAPKPFLTPTLYTDINFIIGLVCIFSVGLVMFATLALLSPYLQDLMNYPVVTAGLVLGPRGGGIMLASILAGRLMKIFSPRMLIGIGFACGAYALYEMVYWTPDISEWNIIWVGVVQGVSVGLIVVPLSIITFATLPLLLRTEATGIYSLMRNLGSSIGISVTGALLVSNSQINHATIAGQVTPFNRALQSGAASEYWNVISAHGAALLNGEVTRQANIIAYVDDFKLMLVLTLLGLPLVFLIRPITTKVVSDGHAAVLD